MGVEVLLQGGPHDGDRLTVAKIGVAVEIASPPVGESRRHPRARYYDSGIEIDGLPMYLYR